MHLPRPLADARSTGQAAVDGAAETVRRSMERQVRRSTGLVEAPPPPCDDPALAYTPPGSPVRTVHGDLPSMLVGGLAALFLQMLHPLAMAGVADHSDYRHDPLGRLARTAGFIGTTTFHSRVEAEAAIARVRAVHRRVVGTTPDGRAYAAGDPALLAWVHAAEVTCFLAANRAYGRIPVGPGEADTYLDAMAGVAGDLGAPGVPRNRADLDAYLDGIREELVLSDQARQARDFLLRGVGRWPHELATYQLLVGAALGILPGWARRQLAVPALPGLDRVVVRPTARTLAAGLRWVVTPPPRPTAALDVALPA